MCNKHLITEALKRSVDVSILIPIDYWLRASIHTKRSTTRKPPQIIPARSIFFFIEVAILTVFAWRPALGERTRSGIKTETKILESGNSILREGHRVFDPLEKVTITLISLNE